jgi:hypothetical protein
MPHAAYAVRRLYSDDVAFAKVAVLVIFILIGIVAAITFRPARALEYS